jgi:hypothetical protein
MNLRTPLLALAVSCAAICFAPSALAFQDNTSPPTSQDTQPVQHDDDADHSTLHQDAHAAGQDIKEGAHHVGNAIDRGAHHVGNAVHRTAHWHRYHVCTHYWHHHCTRWARRHHD